VAALQQALAAYQSATPLDYLVVSGDVKLAVDGVNIINADPLGSMRVAASVDEKSLRDDAKNLVVCCGLALRGYDKELKHAGNKFIAVA
jgi:hypothetical protein